MKVETVTMDGFDADLQRVVASKIEFVADGGSFLYLRKGEASGAIEVATYALQLLEPGLLSATELATKIGVTSAAVAGGAAAFNKAWEFGVKQLDKFLSNLDRSKEVYDRIIGNLEDRRSHENLNSANGKAEMRPIPIDMRVLCTRDEENERAIPLLRAFGARLRHRPSGADSGSHRFHVNEKRFALHFRSFGGRFVGVTGTDPFMQARLKSEFLEEWENCGPDVEE